MSHWCARALALVALMSSGCSFASLLGAPIPCDDDASCPPDLACVAGACGAPPKVEPGIDVFEPFIDVTGLPNLRWSARGVNACVLTGPGLSEEDARASEGVTLLTAPPEASVAAYALTCDTSFTASTSVAWGVFQGATPAGFFQVALLVDGFTSGDGFNFVNLLESGKTFAVGGASTQFAQVPKLRIVHGDFTATANGEGESGTTLLAPSLARVTRGVAVIDSLLVPDLSLDALDSVGTSLRFEGNAGLSTLSLPSLRVVGDDAACATAGCALRITGNNDLARVRLPALETVDTIDISAPSLETLELAPSSARSITIIAPLLSCAALQTIACAASPEIVELLGSEGACAPCE